MKIRLFFGLAAFSVAGALFISAPAGAQQNLPWQNNPNTQGQYGSNNGRSYQEPGETYDPSRHAPPDQQGNQQGTQGNYDRGYDALRNERGVRQREQGRQQPYRDEGNPSYDDNRGSEAPRQYNDQQDYQQPDTSRQANPRQRSPRQGYRPPAAEGPGQAYAPPANSGGNYGRNHQRPRASAPLPQYDDTYSDDEILAAGHRFFGKVTKGMAKVIAHVFKRSGRPNAYILGEEGGGALIAGLRYGEGTIYTKVGDRQSVYWQGPSIGYDFGAEGAKTMILVYNLRNVNEIYNRFAGVDGSAYLVGGVGVTFQKRGRVVLAPIRSGLGVRLGANVGYLKYTRRPTWNPF